MIVVAKSLAAALKFGSEDSRFSCYILHCHVNCIFLTIVGSSRDIVTAFHVPLVQCYVFGILVESWTLESDPTPPLQYVEAINNSNVRTILRASRTVSLRNPPAGK